MGKKARTQVYFNIWSLLQNLLTCSDVIFGFVRILIVSRLTKIIDLKNTDSYRDNGLMIFSFNEKG